jgi:hypothetical protein
MPVYSFEPHRPVRELRIEVGAPGEGLFRPVVLVPAMAQQPRALRQSRLELTQPGDDLLLAGRADQVCLGQRLRQAI